MIFLVKRSLNLWRFLAPLGIDTWYVAGMGGRRGDSKDELVQFLSGGTESPLLPPLKEK